MQADPVTVQRAIRAYLDRAWYAALFVLISPLFYGIVGVVPFVPAYLTGSAWIAVAVLGVRRPTIGDQTYAFALFGLALIGVVGMTVLVALGDQSWIALTSGVVISAICLDSFRAAPDRRRT